MDIINRLPDDIIIHIYTKCLKRYRMHMGEFIKLIDFDKYKFLEKYTYRKIKKFNQLNNFNDSGIIKYSIQCQLPNLIHINRKDSWIDDDMFCMTFTIKDGSLKCDVDRFRLKKIEDINVKSQRNMYYKGKFKEYDWEVLNYTYEI